MIRVASPKAERILIVGAGPVGTLLAILLAQGGLKVRLIERRADPRSHGSDRGRSINLALAARGLKALERAKVLTQIKPDMVEMRGRQLHDRSGDGPLLAYSQHEGEVIYAISRARLNVALIDAAADLSPIDLRFSQRALDIDPRSGSVRWRDERDGAEHSDSAEVRNGVVMLLQPAVRVVDDAQLERRFPH